MDKVVIATATFFLYFFRSWINQLCETELKFSLSIIYSHLVINDSHLNRCWNIKAIRRLMSIEYTCTA